MTILQRSHCLAIRVFFKEPLRIFIMLAWLGVPVAFAQNCTLVIPSDPLGAGLKNGLTYTLSGSGCDETNPNTNTNAFVQVAIIDTTATPANGKVYIYNPLIVNATGPGATAAVTPVSPKLPATYTAAAWFGFNGGVLSLADTTMGNDLSAANC